MGRVEELSSSLSRYAHLLGFPVNVEWVRLVEELQERIMEDVRGEAGGYESLRSFVVALESRGYIAKAMEEVSKALNEEVENAEKALKAAITGDIKVRGARVALIVLQAVARAYAEEALKRGVTVETSALCPLCGALSETMFKEKGGYKMVCHFCSYTWLVSEGKPMCPYCGNQDELSIAVVSDKQMRVALMKCWNCNSTWRTIIDETIETPLILKPLIAMAAEKLRPALGEIERLVETRRKGS
jgi:FdhE protein